MHQTYTPITQYGKTSFTAPLASGRELTHDVYARGEGPAIVLIQELPGIGPETMVLADHLVGKGFHVVMPHFFGPLEKISSLGNMIRVFCMRRQFHLFATNRSSPIVDWLKALCREVRSKTQSKGVGVIGMCLTGNFAMSLMADESVLAAVASQPSMPFANQDSLHMSPEEIDRLKQRLDKQGPMLGFRFEEDWMCSAQKFEAIDQALNETDRQRINLHTLPGKGHSVLTRHFVDESGHPTKKALEEVVRYFSDKLLSSPI